MDLRYVITFLRFFIGFEDSMSENEDRGAQENYTYSRSDSVQ